METVRKEKLDSGEKKKKKKNIKKRKFKNKIDKRKKRKRGPKEVPPRDGSIFFFTEMIQEVLKQLRPKKIGFRAGTALWSPMPSSTQQSMISRAVGVVARE